MLIGSGASLAAQETTSSQDAQPSYQVGKISVKFLGTANVSEEVVRANMQVREGGYWTIR